ncbi:putative membrane protein [Mycetocola sp. CAN_C7]|uniref:cytochrome c oxidase assembly protein n=1 Tax=Mycetocola sp. CAN_C7 TaxID=2787724 RepID=UPI0018CA1739
MHDHAPAAGLDLVLALPFALALVAYAVGVMLQRQRGRRWPWFRSAAWTAGVVVAAAGFVGPLGTDAHAGFVLHMWAHLMVGMVAPLLLLAGAPVTLALRSLHVDTARRLSRMLSSWPARVLTAPVPAAVLNVGGLWVLYSTPLFEAMQQNMLLHLVVMSHFLIAGYLFTAAIIPVDPAPHRAGYLTRAVVLLLALTAHGILAKSIYARAPLGVDVIEARSGAMLMFYAGDIVDAIIIVTLCAQWYRHGGRMLRRASATKPVADAA